MFTVYRKKDYNPEKANNNLYGPREVEVYEIRMNSVGYPHFLIYESGYWAYRSAKSFTPDPAESKLFNGAKDKPVENFYTTKRWKEALSFDSENVKLSI